MCAEAKREFDLAHKEIYDWLMTNQVDNFQKLKDLLYQSKNGLSKLANEQLFIYFNKVMKRVDMTNEKNIQSETFTFPCYDMLDIDREPLIYTDEHTRGGVLPFGRLTNNSGNKFLYGLNQFSIKEIKTLLGGLSSTNFRNALTVINGFRRTCCSQMAMLV